MESLNTTEIVEKIMAKIKEEYANLTTLNVMVLGKTGVGKSTLINHMFGEAIVKTGIGRPVTQNIRKYEKDGFPLAIYDTPGLELDGEHAVDSLLEQVVGVTKDSLSKGDLSSAIHCIWYCVSATSHRFEPSEVSFVKRLLEKLEGFNIPVILILTQAYNKKDAAELKRVIDNENLSIVQAIPVLAENYTLDDLGTIKAYGLTDLTSVMLEVIPEAVKKTFIAMQKADLKLKRAKAHAVVVTAAAASAATGAIPIPFSDAALLVPEQISMIAGITAVFGIPISKATMTAVLTSTIGTAGTTILGKTIVTGLIKLIPGAGSAVGGAISAVTAAALTSALGEAYIGILTMIVSGEMKPEDLDTEEGKAIIANAFKERLQIKRKDNGEPLDNPPD